MLLGVELRLQGPNNDVASGASRPLAAISCRKLLRGCRVSEFAGLRPLPPRMFVIFGNFVDVDVRASSHLLKLHLVDARLNQGGLKCGTWRRRIQALPRLKTQTKID